MKLGIIKDDTSSQLQRIDTDKVGGSTFDKNIIYIKLLINPSFNSEEPPLCRFSRSTVFKCDILILQSYFIIINW